MAWAKDNIFTCLFLNTLISFNMFIYLGSSTGFMLKLYARTLCGLLTPLFMVMEILLICYINKPTTILLLIYVQEISEYVTKDQFSVLRVCLSTIDDWKQEFKSHCSVDDQDWLVKLYLWMELSWCHILTIAHPEPNHRLTFSFFHVHYKICDNSKVSTNVEVGYNENCFNFFLNRAI